MILAGVLFKLGSYGLLCVVPVLFKFGFRFGVVWVALSLVGGLFVSLFCIRQTDRFEVTDRLFFCSSYEYSAWWNCDVELLRVPVELRSVLFCGFALHSVHKT